MQIGELARRTGVSRRALRYYEQHDLLHSRRGPNGWRDYDEAAVDRVLRIAEMIGNGLTLDGVKQLAPCLDMHHSSNCDDPGLPLQTYQDRLAVLDDRLARLQHHRGRLIDQIQALHSP
ncbi:MerR family transcriptional regulator [Amycolatopsis taiwanensis]|uniref:MerR family transcriptional regulator n=1 Tax=Amycolatopsis taiwanensis TaxID=342230 RepID=UPI0004B97EBA|nr:MerR family transcriptional regulator [Amycolatopsis taiwanensis]